MSVALPAIQTALGLGQALFGRKRKFRNPNISPFSFTPDPNDPEIVMRRRAALLDLGRTHDSIVNEIGRAGLLGSSAAFNVLNRGDTEGNAALEDIPNSVYARQRMDALSLYRDNANFQRQLALGDQAGGQQEHMMGLEALGGVGEGIGYSFDDPYSRAAMRKRLLNSNTDYESRYYD